MADNVQIMPLKFLHGNDGGFTFDAVAGILYAEKMGASIVNCSWGSYGRSGILESVIAESDMLFVCAAGNDGLHTSVMKHYPSGYDLPNVISVAALSTNGFLCNFSNYGEVDIAAPGRNIYSTLPKDKYGEMSGTSMAAPFVSGIAALLKSNDPTLSTKMIRQKILAGHSVLTQGGQQPKISANAYGALSVSLETPQPNIGRYGASAAETAKGTFLIGGYDGEGQYISQIEKYDEAQNAWVNAVSAPTLARAFQGSTVMDGQAYLLGGYGSAGISDAVYHFNGIEGALIGYMPAAAYAMAVASDDTYIYTIGGVNDTGYLDDVRRYNVEADTWQTLPDLPVSCGYGKAACWNGYVYVFGGANATGCLSDVYRFNIAANQWETCAPMNVARSNMGFYQSNDKMYVLGGQASYTEDGTDGIISQSGGWTALQTTSVEEYDPALDTWTERIDLPQAKTGFALAEVNETLMLYGGFDSAVSAEGFAYYGTAVPQLHLSTDGDTAIVSWNKIAGVSGYQIEVNGQVTAVGTEASYSHTVREGTVYQYRVRAVFADGEGTWSSPVYKTPYDSRKDAKQITSGTAVNDRLYYRGQEIWYRFMPEGAGTLSVSLGNIPQNCTYRMAIYDEAGTCIANDTDKNGNKVVENLSVLPYNQYIKVWTDFGTDANQAFSLTVSFTPSDTDAIPLRMQMSALQQNITHVTPGSITEEPNNSISYVPPISPASADIWADATEVNAGTTEVCTVKESAPAAYEIVVGSGKKLVVVTRPMSEDEEGNLIIGVPNVYSIQTGDPLNYGYIRYWENEDCISSTHYVSNTTRRYGVLISAKPGELSNNESAEFEVTFHIVDAGAFDTFEPNQNFDDKTVAGTGKKSLAIGNSSVYTSGNSGLNFDTAVDEDYYHLHADAGDKITVSLTTSGALDAADCALYIFSNMDTEQSGTWTDYSYTINRYENPSPPQVSDKMKYVTYVAPETGDYYIYLRYNNNDKGYTESVAGEYKLTVTQTSLNNDTTGERYGEGLTNDFISFNGSTISKELTDSVSGTLDNQLDIDWYKIPAASEGKTKTITLAESDLAQNVTLVLYDQIEQQMVACEENASTITHYMEAGRNYYVGITPKDSAAAWNAVKNKTYTLSIGDSGSSGAILVQPIQFESVADDHYYIYDDNPEYIRRCDILDDSWYAPSALMHSYELQPGTYNVFAYHHVSLESIGDGYTPQDAMFANDTELYFDAIFSNTGNTGGKVKINKLGFRTAVEDSWNCNLRTWQDYQSPYNNSEEFYINASPLFLSDLTGEKKIRNASGTNPDNGIVHLLLEFEVTEGSVDFSTVAYHNKANALQIFEQNGQRVEGKYEYTETLKGQAAASRIRRSNVLDYTINDDVAPNTMLQFKIQNQFYDSLTTDVFVTHCSPWEQPHNVPGSAVVDLAFSGEGVISRHPDGSIAASGGNRTWYLDTMHSRFLESHSVPDVGKMGVYQNKAAFAANEQFDESWLKAVGQANNMELFNIFNGNSTQQTRAGAASSFLST